jgi:hypothetical protein
MSLLPLDFAAFAVADHRQLPAPIECPDEAGNQTWFAPCVYDRTHVDVDFHLKRFSRIMFFSQDRVGYNALYLIVRTSLSHHLECQGGQPMGTWVLADLDNIISDFIDQLRSATERGWHRTKPDHYRSILAALETALKQRREVFHARAGNKRCEPDASSMAGPRLRAPAWPVALRGSFMGPLLGLLPLRVQ